MKMPADYPDRSALNDEVHTRPIEPLVAPCRISYLGLLCGPEEKQSSWSALGAICERYGIAPPPPRILSFSAQLGPFRLQWNEELEFVTWMCIAEGVIAESFSQPAAALLPVDWLASLPGQVLVASHVMLTDERPGPVNPGAIGVKWFDGNVPVGSTVSDGAATVLTDFRIHADGFTRHLLLDQAMTPWQAGRIVQRLMDIEMYRMMALLAVPAARDVDPLLAAAEHELIDITRSMVNADKVTEPQLLDRLTKLQAAIKHQLIATSHRFASSASFHDLVQRRTAELREQGLPGLQTLHQYVGYQLGPAMTNCAGVSARQEWMSANAARAAQLLAIRVNFSQGEHSRALLESMDQQAHTQLRIQSTLEGLGIIVLTYYVCEIIGHLAEVLLTIGVHIPPETAASLSIPIVGIAAWLLLSKTRSIIGRISLSKDANDRPGQA